MAVSAPPSADPNFNIATVNPNEYGANALVKQIMTMMNPEFQREDRGLNESLASNGIVGGSSTGAAGDMANQQETTLLGQVAPIENEAMSRAAGLSEFDASQYNQGNFDLLGMNNQDWLAELGLQGQLAGQGTSAYDPIYSQPGQSDTSGFGQGIGNFGSSSPPPTAPPTGQGWNVGSGFGGN
jgi:hypothetical protein